MKKGDIIWIKYDNCLYCSEIDTVYEQCVERSKTFFIYLNPIIGDILRIYVINEIPKDSFMWALCYSTLLQTYGDFCKIAYDVELLT